MNLIEQTFAQAVLLSGVEGTQQEQMLEMFCRSAVTYLTAQLREGLTPADCKVDFIAAGALYALAALSEVDSANGMQRVQLADVTLVPGDTSAACRCLRKQADMMMAPYCADTFAFRGGITCAK